MAASYKDIRVAVEKRLLKFDDRFNVYDRIPRSLIPPAVIFKPRAHRSVMYPRAMSSGFAEWHWIMQVVVGQVDDKTAQDQVGEMISPDSDFIRILEDEPIGRGFLQVWDGAMAEMMVEDVGLYVHAELSVYIKA